MSRWKRLASMIIAIVFVMNLWPAAVTTAEAANSNTSLETAAPITSGQTVTVTIEPGEVLYYVMTAKAGQFLQATANTVDMHMSFVNAMGKPVGGVLWENAAVAIAETAGTYYLRIIGNSQSSAVTFSFTMTVVNNDVYEPNDLMSTAAEITVGEPINFVWSEVDADWFKITTTKAGQQLVLTSSNTALYYSVYDENANSLETWSNGKGVRYVTTDAAGVYYIRPTFRMNSFVGVTSASFTATLLDNDVYEPNNSMESAVEIVSGQSVDIMVNGSDSDWFSIDLEAGQILTVTMNRDDTGASIYYEDGIPLDTYWNDNGRYIVAEKAGTYYIDCYAHTGMDMVSDTLTVTVADNDAYEPNNTAETAVAITPGETKDMILGYEDFDWFKITTTKPGQIISASLQAAESVSLYVYDTDGEKFLAGTSGTNCSVSAMTGDTGTYYIRCYRSAAAVTAAALTVTLTDNDDYEPNGTQQSAYRLTSGETAAFKLIGNDTDWFAVETTKPGQDIRVDISGFNYANKGSLRVSCDGIDDYYSVSGNKTYYFHAAQAGMHYIKLYEGYCSTADALQLAVTATVLDGDKHETTGSDSEENAVTLHPGTDETFNVGGWGDEDWFQFEVAPEEGSNNLYTLQFLDLNPDYSDEFYYEVYAPDGTVVTSRKEINIHHTNILACDQQGMYKVRIFAGYYNQYGYYLGTSITRSDLRIRVTMGGSDPYENNDTWLTAKPIQPDQLIQHVLAATTDSDWFYFTAEEADMSYAIDTDSSVSYYIYRAEDLAEYGENTNYYVSTSKRGKLGDAGVYYVEMYTGSSYVSEDLRAFTITLTPHSGEENNDTWDKAVPLYEYTARNFDIAGSNDTDWFKLTVPEGASHAVLQWSNESNNGAYYSVYREEDIEKVGLNTGSIFSGDAYDGAVGRVDVSEGTYYVRVKCSGLAKGCTLTYYLSYDEGDSGREDAIALQPGQWSEARSKTTWYSLGTLKAGDVVRYNRDASGRSPTVYLYDATGDSYRTGSSYANYTFSISADGEYYLQVSPTAGWDANAEPYTARIRYDIGTGSDYVTTMEGPDTITLTVGETQFADLRLAPYTAMSASGNRIYLNNNTDSSVATFHEYTGYVTANTVGTTEMRFGVYTGKTTLNKTVIVNVVEPVAAAGVSISGAPEELALGSNVLLSATLTPGEATEQVVWSSSDTSVLYVIPGGRVVAVGEGEATVTASVAAGSDSVTIKVVPAELTEDEITGMVLDQYALTMYMGEGTQKLAATVLPEGIAANVKWASSNTAAATVDQSGVVTAVAPGISIITASAGDHSVSCIVTVQAARVRVTGISFADEKLQIPLGGQTTLLPTIEPYNATTRTLTWVSDDESVATVSRTGIVNALAVGETTIRATTLDGGFVAEITIEVTAAPQRGDINGDGCVDSADARITLRVAVGLVTLTEEQEKAADVNGDGYVDAGDGVKILRYDAKLIDSLD